MKGLVEIISEKLKIDDVKLKKELNVSASSGAIREFDHYSGTSYKDSLRFLGKVVNEIPELLDYEFELFYSGYAGYTVKDNKGKKIFYICFDKTVFGLEDFHRGKGWNVDGKFSKGSKEEQWAKIINELGENDESRPKPIHW